MNPRAVARRLLRGEPESVEPPWPERPGVEPPSSAPSGSEPPGSEPPVTPDSSLSAPSSTNIYETLYEAHARRSPGANAVGAVSFDLIGRKELALLQMEGLRPEHTVVDVGCGVGRLAIHLVPWLRGGRYIGTDVAPSMLQQAQAVVSVTAPSPPCEVRWVKHDDLTFPLDDASVDMLGAFSVFTHLEHEDTFTMLRDARRVARPGGKFVFSCLPLDLPYAQGIFAEQAAVDFHQRWSTVRNVTTSVDLMEAIAEMAGWQCLRWYGGEDKVIAVEGDEELQGFGQSVCVLGTRGL